MPQTLTTAEIRSLSTELDIFSAAREPRPDLIERALYPPLPICSGILVWGFPILRSAERLGLSGVNCLSVPSRPRVEMLALALKLEDRAGRFSWQEKQRMREYLAASAPPPELTDLCARLSTLIEDHRDPQLSARIGSFAALPPGLKALVAEGQIDLKSAIRVQSLPEPVFSRLQDSTLTFSQRRQFLNELFEVSRRGDHADAEIREMAERALRDPRPLDAIHKLRFPTLTALQQRFAELEGELLKGSGVQLKPPPHFEGDSFTVAFDFRNARTYNRKLNVLLSLKGHLDAILQLLH
jgi:hypothetical protein